MAERLIQKACDQFRADLTSDQVEQIQSVQSIDDIKRALQKVERELAARQALRGFGRIAPFIDAIEHYAKAIEVACNGTPFMPWIWAPIKLVILAIQESTSCLDKILSAYAKIGQRMPRFARYAGAFPNDPAFQHLLASLFQDIIEFHRKSFELVRKPAWKVFFTPLWGRFHSRFDELLNSISFISDEIDREAISIDIVKTQEVRQMEREDNLRREARLQAEQVSAVMGWLASDIMEQEDRLEWLQSRCHDGTSSWITNHKEFRTWMRFGGGKPVLWVNGKPGSGKSVLGSNVVTFLRNAKRNVAYYICNYQTSPTNVTAQILRSICAQIITMMPEFVPYTFDEYISNAKTPSTTCLVSLLNTFLDQVTELRLVFDGLDEVQSSEHRKLISDLMRLAKGPDTTCRILFLSQDIPTIHGPLSKVPVVRLGQERSHIDKDLDLVIQTRLHEIDEQTEGMLGSHNINVVGADILARSEGMFLWVHLILELLTNASSLSELKNEVATIPKDLTTLYIRILDRIKSRSGDNFGKIRRIFSWLLCHKGGEKVPLSRHTVRVAMAIHPDRPMLVPDAIPHIHAVDICKPLIEDGPNGSLAFIHSTVAEFLVQEQSGPFMSLQEANTTVAYACMAHLIQSFQLMSDENATESSLSVAHFVHGFIPYAHRFWYDHLSQCADATIPGHLKRLIVDLCTSYLQLPQSAKDSERSITQLKVPDGIFQGLDDNNIATLQQLISNFSNDQSSDNCTHPTMTVVERHRSIVRKLLSATDMAGIPKEVLLHFKDTVGHTAFTCTKFDCPRSISGFSSEAILRQHSSTHGPPLRCFEGCKMNDVGFTSAKSLKVHKRKFHGEQLPEIPRAFRHKQQKIMDSTKTSVDEGTVPAIFSITEAHFTAGAGRSMQRPGQQQLASIISAHQSQTRPATTGWQNQVSDSQRLSQTGALINNSFLAMPTRNTETLVQLGIKFEKEAFLTSSNKATYESKMHVRISDLFRLRHEDEKPQQSKPPVWPQPNEDKVPVDSPEMKAQNNLQLQVQQKSQALYRQNIHILAQKHGGTKAIPPEVHENFKRQCSNKAKEMLQQQTFQRQMLLQQQAQQEAQSQNQRFEAGAWEAFLQQGSLEWDMQQQEHQTSAPNPQPQHHTQQETENDHTKEWHGKLAPPEQVQGNMQPRAPSDPRQESLWAQTKEQEVYNRRLIERQGELLYGLPLNFVTDEELFDSFGGGAYEGH